MTIGGSAHESEPVWSAWGRPALRWWVSTRPSRLSLDAAVPGHSCPLLPIAAISWSGQVLSRSSSRVRSPGSSTGAVVLRSQTALTGSDRPRTIWQREQGRPACADETCCMSSGPRLHISRQPPGVWRRRSGSASGSAGERAVAAARAARRAALSEVIGLPPECLHADQVAIDWKLYELNGRFYRGRPKDGSIRPADLPPFLAELLADHLANAGSIKCTCRNTEPPWCPGAEYVFLGPGLGHFRRSNYSERFFRPAADGWYLPRNGKNPRPAVPVLVTDCELFPGRPVPPWPLATLGEDFAPPTGRGLVRLVNDEHTGRCQVCGRAWPRRLDGTLIAHARRGRDRCLGAGQAPAEDMAVASWLPVLRRVTPHGLRHGLQTWMDEDGIPEVLKTERMGHEMPGMHGVYGHVSPGMRASLKTALQARWENSIRQRASLSPGSIVPALDKLLSIQQQVGSAAS